MRLAIFRADADGRRTADRLEERGHTAVLAPVIRIAPTFPSIDAGPGDAAVFTSQHAVEALSTSDQQRLRNNPCFCVGDRTAMAARVAGFGKILVGAGDADALATTIIEHCPPRTRVVLIAGRDRKPGLEAELSKRNFDVLVIEAYAAEPVERWSDATAERLSRCDGALHYSARTAELAYVRCEMDGLAAGLHGWVHYCLSADVAEPLRARAVADVRVAPQPQESALLALL